MKSMNEIYCVIYFQKTSINKSCLGWWPYPLKPSSSEETPDDRMTTILRVSALRQFLNGYRRQLWTMSTVHVRASTCPSRGQTTLRCSRSCDSFYSAVQPIFFRFVSLSLRSLVRSAWIKVFSTVRTFVPFNWIFIQNRHSSQQTQRLIFLDYQL